MRKPNYFERGLQVANLSGIWRKASKRKGRFAPHRRQAGSHRDREGAIPVGAGLPAMGVMQANDQPLADALGFFSRWENTACKSSEALSSSRFSLLSIWSM